MINYQELLISIIKKFKDNSNIQLLTKTRLLKISYLIELKYYRKFNKRLTNSNWVYYKYGPYIFNYDDFLKSPISVQKDDNDDFSHIDLENNVDIPNFDIDINVIIGSTIKEFGDLDLNKLLDYIYYDTEPMMNAEQRGQELDFSFVKSEDYYKLIKFKNPNDVKKIILKKYPKIKK